MYSKHDVVVENFALGTMSEWGLGHAAVRQCRPDIIYVSISGFGQFGPGAETAAIDSPVSDGIV
ncbi:MAG TPA: CoA transferase [Candidatus Binatia bacterium]|nr:CoA transferase [Candidatus Binatia bacterium]